jgi:hypothetical protein
MQRFVCERINKLLDVVAIQLGSQAAVSGVGAG